MKDAELLRYSRHILLPQIDIAGQEKIIRARVLVVGLGGLGSPVAMYLAAAGVGKIYLCDDDIVEESNLQRQIMHNQGALGLNKAVSAQRTLEALNSGVCLEALAERMSDTLLIRLLPELDMVVDCCDNFATRALLNGACRRANVPLVSGAAIGFEGQLSVFNYAEGSPCYACLYSLLGEEQRRCTEAGIFSPVVGVIGSTQALEALKILAGIGSSLVGKLALFDGLSGKWHYLALPKDPSCKVCSGQ